jgi:hypothetical protein
MFPRGSENSHASPDATHSPICSDGSSGPKELPVPIAPRRNVERQKNIAGRLRSGAQSKLIVRLDWPFRNARVSILVLTLTKSESCYFFRRRRNFVVVPAGVSNLSGGSTFLCPGRHQLFELLAEKRILFREFQGGLGL